MYLLVLFFGGGGGGGYRAIGVVFTFFGGIVVGTFACRKKW